MIVIHDETGFVTQTVLDPVPPGHADFLHEKGILFVETNEEVGHEIHSEFYIRAGKIKRRPRLDVPESIEIVADGQDEKVIKGLPKPCCVLIDGVEHAVTGGTLEISADVPGEYDIEFRQWPYLTAKTKVIAHAPETH